MRAESSVPAVLQALSRELAELHADAVALQDELAPTYDACAAPGLQRLDAMTQALDALTAYTGRLAAAAAEGAPLDPTEAAGAVPLVALARRLALEAPRPAVVKAGEADFF